MRALENFNRQRDKKLGSMVGVCMKGQWSCYAVINASWLIMTLAHPSHLAVLDGLVFGVIAIFPVWTDQRWAKRQAILFAVIVAVRHLIYYMRGCRVVDPWKVTNLIGMFCIGGLI